MIRALAHAEPISASMSLIANIHAQGEAKAARRRKIQETKGRGVAARRTEATGLMEPPIAKSDGSRPGKLHLPEARFS
jgi:hypothetical protein